MRKHALIFRSDQKTVLCARVQLSAQGARCPTADRISTKNASVSERAKINDLDLRLRIG
jgi:hypothetical protein